jgi:hypothetical protein
VSVALWRSWTAQTSRANRSFLATAIAGFRGTTNIVLNDSVARLISRAKQDQIPLEDYANRRMLDPPPPPLAAPELAGLVDSMRNAQITSLVNAILAYRIGTEIPSARFALRHSRDLRARDFHSENFLFLAANNSTPWTALFQNDLNFQIHNTSEPRCVIRNRRPLAGEQSEYAERFEPDTRITYGRAALFPNLTGTGSILLVEGITMEATEAVVSLFLDPGSRAQIERAIPAGSARWEVLVRARVVSGSGGAAQIVAARAHPK